jgi:hypothetical protein
MGALTIGAFSSTRRERRVVVSTSRRERTVDFFGISNTSSKVKPFTILFEAIINNTVLSVGEILVQEV